MNKMSLNKKISDLPLVLQTIIYQYYWSIIFNNVLSEIVNVRKLELEIGTYIISIKYNSYLLNEKYLKTYKKFNEKMKLVESNKGLKLLSKFNNLRINRYDMNIYRGMSENIKYLAPFLVSVSGEMRYDIFYKLKNLKI